MSDDVFPDEYPASTKFGTDTVRLMDDILAGKNRQSHLLVLIAGLRKRVAELEKRETQ